MDKIFWATRNTCIAFFPVLIRVSLSKTGQEGWAVEYTDCNSAEIKDLSPMSTQDISLNNLMVRLQ